MGLSYDDNNDVEIAEPATFTVAATDVVLAQNKSMFSLTNQSGSTVFVTIKELFLTNAQTTAVTGVVANFELRRITSHSAGTALTPVSHDSLDTLNGSVTARTGATVAGESATPIRRWKWSSDEWGTGTVDVEAQDHGPQSLLPHYAHRPGIKGIILRPNEGLTLKQTVNTTAGSFDIVAVFTQEDTV